MIKIFKYFAIILFVGNLTAQVEIPTLKNYATDLTNSLSSGELNQLNSGLKSFEDKTSNQIIFLMISSLEGYSLEMYSYETADKNKIGTKENDNGALFLVVKDDRKFRIEVGYGLEGALPDALAGSILRNEVKPYFKRGNYFGGIKAGLDAIMAATQGEYTAKPKTKEDDGDKGFGFIIYIIIFILMAIFGKGRRGGFLSAMLLGSMLGGGRSSGGGGLGGGGFGGGGGFSGGGGGFGGGGASGGW